MPGTLTDQPLRDRRARLEVLFEPARPCLQLIAQTSSLAEAEDWLNLVPGIEGVVAKRWDGRYLPSQREWIKVKKLRTAECVVIAIAGDATKPSLVLGLRHADGQLHHLGRIGGGICHVEWTRRLPTAVGSFSQETRLDVCVSGIDQERSVLRH